MKWKFQRQGFLEFVLVAAHLQYKAMAEKWKRKYFHLKAMMRGAELRRVGDLSSSDDEEESSVSTFATSDEMAQVQPVCNLKTRLCTQIELKPTIPILTLGSPGFASLDMGWRLGDRFLPEPRHGTPSLPTWPYTGVFLRQGFDLILTVVGLFHP